jgi:hypothetical protein
MKQADKMTPEERERCKSALLMQLMGHIGQSRRIGMGELYSAVFGRPWANRINDTRALRRLISELRREGAPIVSDACRESGGYYLASAGSELAGYCGRLRRRALGILVQEACMRKISMGELFGQIQIEFTGEAAGGNG